jgi:hypothetical protein
MGKRVANEDRPTDLFRPELLDRESLAILAQYADNLVVAGAVLNRSSRVVGVSNVFTKCGAGSEGWTGCLAYAASIFPAMPLVGYESDEGLVAARGHGFKIAGPLRIWIADG